MSIVHLRSNASSLRQGTDKARPSQAVNTSQNKVLENLTTLNRLADGRLPDIIYALSCWAVWTLGRLGTIPDKYDVAVSTACGAVNNMVVEPVPQCKAYIEFLRKHNIGCAS
ncbi:hypothetical protein K503DRAFT_780550 [Rhizopogon vinicolor AM-OR11-026]|uniref:SMC hinge domain-containing protein n=1 Tax=Rhizopogon vinicolor AM-OR11-026 TaxID=1314800 RepID=A0A1B7N9S4_9AGAM|nr:hypothetical protein K503DRAFT_780550 [Rhizopogon vinicolor AM-OR11-026]